MRYQVKLSKRYALRLLQTQDCKVFLSNEYEKDVCEEHIYTTRARDFEGDVIYVYDLHRYIDIENIKSIEHQATRFSDLMIFEEVDWK